jgi:DNA polymerase epsilon subunit 1
MGLPTLVNEFPVLKIKPLASDNEFPPLDWVRFAAKNMSIRFIELKDNIKERINYSRYSYIPVCNLEEDAPLFIIDTLYARTLKMH